MNPTPNSLGDPARLNALRNLKLLDSDAEESSDRLTRLVPGRKHSRLIDDMMVLFLAGMPQELAKLRQLAEQKSKNELAMLAHSIAGTCANLGASAMRSSGLQLENAAREGHWTEVRGRLDALGRQWIETKLALQQFQNPILHENSYR